MAGTARDGLEIAKDTGSLAKVVQRAVDKGVAVEALGLIPHGVLIGLEIEQQQRTTWHRTEVRFDTWVGDSSRGCVVDVAALL